MYFFSACGTRIINNPAYGKVIAYIHSCDIFPNSTMIAEATGVTEQQAKHAVGHLFAQGNRYFSRVFFLSDIEGTPITDITKEEMLIASYLEREENGRDFSALPVIRSFMERHRYYDDDGNIRCRFSEEQIKATVDAYQKYSKH